MKRNLLAVILVCLLISSFLVIACSTSSGTSSATPSSKTTTSLATSVSSAAASATPNWWAKFGEPQYGGTLNLRSNMIDVVSFDPAIQNGGGFGACYEALWMSNWTLDRNTWSFNTAFAPVEYVAGLLVKDWEQTDTTTVTVHLRQGVHWQNKAPVNGREFIADDVQYTFDRLLGTGSGFTEPSPWYSFMLSNVEKVITVDKYTVQFKFKKAGAMSLFQIMGAFQSGVVACEAVEQGDLKNWESAVGTGPWIVSDYVAGSSLSYNKNPDYWGYDERYPENKLPYIDTVTIIQIPDASTALAAMRTSKIDTLGSLSWREKQTLSNTNPDIVWASSPDPAAAIDLICNQKPFTDIKVRTALQLAIDLNTIAKSLFGGTVEGIPCGPISPTYTGFAFPYSEWSDTLKQEYSYNPDQAKELLAEAGYANGFATHIVASSQSSSELMQAIKAYFKDINVEMTIKMMETAAFESFTRAKKADQMIMSNWAGGLASPDMSFNSCVSNGPVNYTVNNDANFDDLYTRFVAAATMDEAKHLSVEADKYAIEQHWRVCTFPQSKYNAWQPWIRGYSGEMIGDNGGTSAYWARLYIMK